MARQKDENKNLNKENNKNMIQNHFAADSHPKNPTPNNIKSSFNDSFLAEALKLSQEGFWNYNFEDDRFVITNEIYSILELPTDTDLSNIKSIADKLLPGERAKLIHLQQQITNNINLFDFNLKVVLKDGSNKFLSIKAKLKRDIELNPLQMIGTYRDITEEYYQNQKLKENEELFRSLFNNLTDIFIIFELERDSSDNVVDYIYKDVNPVFEMKFNLPKNEIIQKKLSLQVQLFQQFHPLLKITALTREPHQNSLFIQSIDSFVDVLIYSPSENLVATIWRDVSMMVEANSSLQESEEKYRQIFSIGKDGLIMFDFFSGKIMDVNPAVCEMFGFSKDQLVKMLFKSLFAEPEILESKILEQKSTNINCISIKQNGSDFPSEASLSYFNWSGRKVVVASVRDISEWINAQKELVESEKKFKQLFDFSNDAIFIIKDYKIVEFNQKSQQLFNIAPSVIFNNNLWSFSPPLQPNGDNSRVKMLGMLQQAIQGTQLHFEWVFENPDRSIFFADIKLSSIIFENEKIIQAIVRDVSPRKLSEEALILKESRWKQSLEISITGMWEWNIITNEVYFSKVWKEIIGYEREELPNVFEEYEKRIHPDDLDLVFNSFQNYFAAKTSSFTVNFRFRCKNGSYKWINSKGKIFVYNNEGKPERFMGTHSDITYYKLNEQKLIETLEKYRLASEITRMGYWELNLRNLIITAPEQTFQIFGLNTQQATLRQIENMVHPEDQQKFASQFVAGNEDKKRKSIFRIIIHNETHFIVSISTPLVNSKNTLIGFEGIFQDITTFKQKEQQLKDDQKLIKSYLNKTKQAIITIQDDQIVYLNNRFSDITGFQPDDLNSSGFKFIDQVVPEDKPIVQAFFDRISDKSRSGESIVFRLETKFNRIKWLELTSTISELKGREATLFIIEDINDKKINDQNIAAEFDKKNQIFKHSPAGISLVSLDEKFTHFNHEFSAITGFNEKELLKVHLKDLFKPSDYDNISTIIDKFKKGKSTEYINQMELKNNIYTSLSFHAVKNEINEVQYFILHLKNIDLIRKQIEQLMKDNSIHNNILKSLPGAIGLFDSTQKLIRYNQKLLSCFNLNEPDLPLYFSDFSKLQPGSSKIFEKVLNSHEPQSFIYNNDHQKTFSIELINLQMDFSTAVLFHATDVTEANNQTRLMAGQLDKFESIFNNSPSGIALIDKSRNIVTFNQKYSSILNYSSKELQNIKLDQLIQTENLSELINNFSELFTDVKPQFVQNIQFVDKKGTKRWINSTFTPLFDQYKEITFAIHVIDDISQLKEKEYSIINTERMKTLSYLANSFAHEFNNHLMAMYGNSFLLKSNITDPDLSKYADSLFTTITKASELTHNLLSFSKNNSKINVLINLPQLIDQLIDQMEINHKIEYKTTYDKKTENILGDSSLLQRAFQIIIENAIESMPNGGELTIETKSVYFEKNQTTATLNPEKGKYIRIRIGDTGIGIKKTDLEKIFDPFFTTKSTLQNAGLGLTIALKTIQEHGGTIKANSSAAGTDMMIYLPQPSEELIRNNIQPDEQLIIKGSANLLIIDDEDVVRIVTGELLKKLGYNVFSFASGSRALKFYKENIENIDLVVLDKHMPEMDGALVYRKLTEMNANVKVVLLTGFNIDNDILDVFENKNNQIIQKPAGIEKLSKAISALLLYK